MTNSNFLSRYVDDSKFVFVFDNTPYLNALDNDLVYSESYIKDKNANGFYDLDIDISVKMEYNQTSTHSKVLAFFTVLLSFLSIILIAVVVFYLKKRKDLSDKLILVIQKRLNRPEKIKKKKLTHGIEKDDEKNESLISNN